MDKYEGILVMTCDVDFGSSGAPIFSITDGVARIVSVVSAKADMDGDRVALGTNLDEPLAQLYAALEAEGGVFRDPPPGQMRVISTGERNETGAKFVTVD